MFSPLLYNSNVSLENCPSNFSNVPLNVDEWDRMSPLYPDLDRSLLVWMRWCVYGDILDRKVIHISICM